MIEYNPTTKEIAKAKSKGKKMGVLYNSFTKGAGNETGMMGEIVAHLYMPDAVCVSEKSRTHDFEMYGKTIDVKSKKCKGKPLPEYVASVSFDTGKYLKSDILLFTRVAEDLKTVWVLGWYPTALFYKNAQLIERGTVEGRFIHRITGYHLPIKKLRPISKLLAYGSTSGS